MGYLSHIKARFSTKGLWNKKEWGFSQRDVTLHNRTGNTDRSRRITISRRSIAWLCCSQRALSFFFFMWGKHFKFTGFRFYQDNEIKISQKERLTASGGIMLSLGSAEVRSFMYLKERHTWIRAVWMAQHFTVTFIKNKNPQFDLKQ